MALESLLALLKNLIIFSSYVTEKSSFPKPLSKEKEKEYLEKSAQGDKEAKEILVKHNLRLVAHIAKKYSNYGDNDELISIGDFVLTGGELPALALADSVSSSSSSVW